jgi:hypothetical protein
VALTFRVPRTKAALAAAKRRGVQLGGPRLAAARKASIKVRSEGADAFAANVRPIIKEIQASGVSSLRGVARAARGGSEARVAVIGPTEARVAVIGPTEARVAVIGPTYRWPLSCGASRARARHKSRRLGLLAQLANLRCSEGSARRDSNARPTGLAAHRL